MVKTLNSLKVQNCTFQQPCLRSKSVFKVQTITFQNKNKRKQIYSKLKMIYYNKNVFVDNKIFDFDKFNQIGTINKNLILFTFQNLLLNGANLGDWNLCVRGDRHPLIC